MQEQGPESVSDGAPEQPLELVTAIGVAALLGVSRQRVSQLLRAQRLPRPIARINGTHPAWSPLQFVQESGVDGDKVVEASVGEVTDAGGTTAVAPAPRRSDSC